MRNRTTAASPMPCKNQDLCVSVRGKDYYICSNQQMGTLRNNMTFKVLNSFRDRRELPPSDDDLSELVDAEVAETGYATIDMILAKLSPVEQEQWRAQYRFSGVWGKRR